MPKGQSSTRERPSIVLDAGYVPISRQLIEDFHRERRRWFGVIILLVFLFLLSLINCFFLFWLIGRIDWSVIASHSKGLPLNQSTFFDWIYASRIHHSSPIDLVSSEQIDFYGEHNSIFFDDDQIVLHSENFRMKNFSSPIDFSRLHRLKFDPTIPTRVHLAQVSTRKIHHQRVFLHAHQALKVSPQTQHIQFYSQQLNFESTRHSSRSSVRFRSEAFRLKSDVLFLDLPQYPLYNRSEPTRASRLCLCDWNRHVFSVQAEQACPFC